MFPNPHIIQAVIREISYEVNNNNMTVMLKKLSEQYWESRVTAPKKQRPGRKWGNEGTNRNRKYWSRDLNNEF